MFRNEDCRIREIHNINNIFFHLKMGKLTNSLNMQTDTHAESKKLHLVPIRDKRQKRLQNRKLHKASDNFFNQFLRVQILQAKALETKPQFLNRYISELNQICIDFSTGSGTFCSSKIAENTFPLCSIQLYTWKLKLLPEDEKLFIKLYCFYKSNSKVRHGI